MDPKLSGSPMAIAVFYPKEMMMNLREALRTKYDGYAAQGHAIFAVTLSTYVKSESIARSHLMSDFWDSHFLHRVRRCLPFKLKTHSDHDFVIERSPEGYFHYHGLLAFTHEAGERFWPKGELNPKVKRSLDTFHNKGAYRPFCVNSFLIEPIRAGQLAAWIHYITKENEIPTSSCH